MLRRSVLASGGFSAAGGGFAVTGTLGEAIADDVLRARGGRFEVIGGFWPAGGESAQVFADGFEPQP